MLAWFAWGAGAGGQPICFSFGTLALGLLTGGERPHGLLTMLWRPFKNRAAHILVRKHRSRKSIELGSALIN